MTTVGLPYANATADAAGRYWVVCPECGYAFRGTGGTEVKVTKSAALEYAIHYEKTHSETRQREDDLIRRVNSR